MTIHDDVLTESKRIQSGMAKRSPRIKWTVKPSFSSMDIQSKSGQFEYPFRIIGYVITGEFFDLTFSREIPIDYFRFANLDIVEYMAHEMTNAIASELMK